MFTYRINRSAEKENTCSIKVGESYLIRTVTFYYTGQVEKVTDSDIVLNNAAWIVSTGRFGEALLTGKLDGVEPYPSKVIVSRGAIVDATLWTHPLPRVAM